MSWKLKLFTVLNAVGWLVVVPILAGALLDPFVDFRGWPGGSLFDSKGDTVRLADVRERERFVRETSRPAPARVVVLPGGAAVTVPGGTSPGEGPEARPGLQNRLLVGAGTVAPDAPFVLRDSASFANGRAPGSDRPIAGVPVTGTAGDLRPPESTTPASTGGSVPTRAVDRPVAEAPAPPTKNSGPTALSEGPVEVVDAVPTPVTSEAPVTAPETPAAPDPGSDSGTGGPAPTPPPPPDEDDDGPGNGNGKGVQPSKHDGPDDDEGNGNGKGKGKGGGNN